MTHETFSNILDNIFVVTARATACDYKHGVNYHELLWPFDQVKIDDNDNCG